MLTGAAQLSVDIANIANQQGHLQEKMMRLQFSSEQKSVIN